MERTGKKHEGQHDFEQYLAEIQLNNDVFEYFRQLKMQDVITYPEYGRQAQG